MKKRNIIVLLSVVLFVGAIVQGYFSWKKLRELEREKPVDGSVPKSAGNVQGKKTPKKPRGEAQVSLIKVSLRKGRAWRDFLGILPKDAKTKGLSSDQKSLHYIFPDYADPNFDKGCLKEILGRSDLKTRLRYLENMISFYILHDIDERKETSLLKLIKEIMEGVALLPPPKFAPDFHAGDYLNMNVVDHVMYEKLSIRKLIRCGLIFDDFASRKEKKFSERIKEDKYSNMFSYLAYHVKRMSASEQDAAKPQLRCLLGEDETNQLTSK